MVKHSSQIIKPQHLAITGATGFIGRHLVTQLHQEGHQIWVILRPTTAVPTELNEMVRPIIFDGNVEKLAAELQREQISGIIHLASLFLAQHTLSDITNLVDSNILFGTQLLEAASRANITWFINTGTFWQHFQNAQYAPVNLYAATKQAFLAIAQYYYETRSINFLTLELSDTFGPADPRPKLISLWQKILQTGETLGMSPGEQKIDLNYIENVVHAYSHAVTLLVNDKTHIYQGKSFAISSGNILSLKELAVVFEKVSGKKLPIIWGQKEYRPREIMEPWSQGKVLPGWKAQVSLEEGIRRTLAVK